MALGSQSLSGWDGVFHFIYVRGPRSPKGSQSLSGWDGVFHKELTLEPKDGIVFRRNPFQGGMGFFTSGLEVLWVVDDESQSLSGWDGVFHGSWSPQVRSVARVAIPFRVGWGFSLKNESGS